jgi:hypothetical protein
MKKVSIFLLLFLSCTASNVSGGSQKSEHPKRQVDFTPIARVEKLTRRIVHLNEEIAKVVAQAVISVLKKEDGTAEQLLESEPLKTQLGDYLFVSIFGAEKTIRCYGRAQTYKDSLKIILAGLKERLPKKVPNRLSIRVEEVEDIFPLETAEEAAQNIRLGIDSLFVISKEDGKTGRPLFVMADEILIGAVSDLQALSLLLMTRYPEGSLFARFRTVSYLYLYPEGEIVRLFRLRRTGVTLTTLSVKQAIVDGADYLLRVQEENGRFGYFYDATSDKFLEGESHIRQTTAACVLLSVYELTKESKYLEGAEKSINFLKGICKEHQKHDFVYTKDVDGSTNLGGAAVLLWTLAVHKDVTNTHKFSDLAHKLAKFLLFMQCADGSFNTFYDPVTDTPKKVSVQFYPGEAVFALAVAARIFDRREYLEASIKGYRALAKEVSEKRKAEPYYIDAWLMKAALSLSAHLDETDIKVVYDMADRLVEAQKALAESPFPDYRGAFSVRHGYPNALSDAALCEGLAAAYKIANSTQNPKAEIYKEALKLQSQFHLRHRIDRVNGHFLPNPERAYGAFTSSLLHLQVRIDGIQHTISTLLSVLQILSSH